MAPQNRIIIFIIKVSVSALLLFVLMSKVGAERLFHTIREVSPVSFVSSAMLYVFSIFISAIRWRLLLMKGVNLKRLFSLYLIGSFFNNLMPGIIGGDAVKAYYLSRTLKDYDGSKGDQRGNPLHSSLSLASVFMDRYIGFISLLIIAIVAYPFGKRYFSGTYIEWILPLIISIFLAGSFILFAFRFGSSLRFMAGFYDYLKYYKSDKGMLLKCLFLSLLIQVAIICTAYVISRGLGVNVPPYVLFVVIPVISVISSIPVSISGLGVREASFVLFLAPLGVTQAQALTLSLTWFLSFVAGSLLGLVFYIRLKT